MLLISECHSCAERYGVAMSIHLVGGGSAPEYNGEVYEEFLEEAADRARARGVEQPVIGVLLVAEHEDSAREYAESLTAMLTKIADCEVRATAIVEGELFTLDATAGIDAISVWGGLTPAYLDAVIPIVETVRTLVGEGMPYLGYSAGAMIAADTAIIGGWKINDIPVCAEDTGEDLDDVTIVEGLGLVDLAIDVHAAQWGTLARLIAATEAGLVEGGVAIDEYTALIVDDSEIRVVGSGSIWQVSLSDDGVLVNTLGAS
jgi:cyanophycinase